VDTKNVVVLAGRLAADPELRYLPNGTPVANFAVAVNRSTRKPDGSFEDSLEGFFDCEVFDGQALALAENAGKGAEVHVTGSLVQKKFQTKGSPARTVSKIEVRVSSVAPAMPVQKDVQAAVPQEVAAPQPV